MIDWSRVRMFLIVVGTASLTALHFVFHALASLFGFPCPL